MDLSVLTQGFDLSEVIPSILIIGAGVIAANAVIRAVEFVLQVATGRSETRDLQEFYASDENDPTQYESMQWDSEEWEIDNDHVWSPDDAVYTIDEETGLHVYEDHEIQAAYDAYQFDLNYEAYKESKRQL